MRRTLLLLALASTTLWAQPIPGGGGGSGPNGKIRTVQAQFGTIGGTALSTTLTACVLVPFAGTISAANLASDVSGAVTVDVRTVLLSSWTGVASASTITASDTPALSGTQTYTDGTLTGWTKAIAANTMVCFVLSSPSTLGWVGATLQVAVSN